MNAYTVRIDPEDENSEMTWHPIRNSAVDKLTAVELKSTADLISANSETLMTDESFLEQAEELDLTDPQYSLAEAISEYEWERLVKQQNAEFKAKYGIDLDEPELEEVDKIGQEEDCEENEDKRFERETKELVIRPKVIPFGGTLRVNHKTIKHRRPLRFQIDFRPIEIN